ncbi:MAG: TatD family hydrolase [Pseudomonadota bacterium]
MADATHVLVDSHCHLDFDAFDEERDDVIARAHAAGVQRMVTICTRVRQFDRIHAVAMKYDSVYCSVGTHPHNASEETDVTVDELLALAERPKVVAIGEAGLDYFYDHAPRDAQAAGLRVHIDAARRTGLPLVIHSRDADEDMANILREEMDKGAFSAVLHCFSSSRDLALTGIELGLYVSFSGIVTFKKSQELRDLAAELPADRIVVETDAPYLAPTPHRGQRNEPAYTVETAKVVAEARGVDYATMAAQTTDNFFKLFNRVPRPSQADTSAGAPA